MIDDEDEDEDEDDNINQSESNFSGIEEGMTLAMISGINQKYIHYF